jgi:hypothetical protein
VLATAVSETAWIVQQLDNLDLNPGVDARIFGVSLERQSEALVGGYAIDGFVDDGYASDGFAPGKLANDGLSDCGIAYDGFVDEGYAGGYSDGGYADDYEDYWDYDY